MLTLFIDTVAPENAILLLDEKKIVAQKSWSAHLNEAEKLLPEIERLLSENQKTFVDITLIGAVTGPGRFTSTRVGITVANTLSYLLKVPILGIDRLDIITTFIFQKYSTIFPLRVYLQSERGDYFSKYYSDLETQTPIELLPKLPEGALENCVAVDNQGQLISSTFSLSVRALYDLKLAIPQVLTRHNKISEMNELLHPIYAREANITVRKKR